MAKLSDIYVSGVFAPVATSGEYGDLIGKPDIAAIAPNRWTTTGIKTANYVAETAENIPCDSSGGPFSITLPSVGSRIRVFDSVGGPDTPGFYENPVTVLPSPGTTVMESEGMILDLSGGAFEFELVGTDWRVNGGIVPIQEPWYEGSDRETLTFVLTEGNAFLGTDLATLEYAPYAAIITSMVLVVKNAPVGANLIVDFNKNNVSMLSTKISIDAGELNSTTAAIPYVLSSTSWALGDRLSADIDQVGVTPSTNVQLIVNAVRV